MTFRVSGKLQNVRQVRGGVWGERRGYLAAGQTGSGRRHRHINTQSCPDTPPSAQGGAEGGGVSGLCVGVASGQEFHNVLFERRCVPPTCRSLSTETAGQREGGGVPGHRCRPVSPEEDGGWGVGCSKKPAEAELIPSQDFKLVNVLHQSESIRVKVTQQLQGLFAGRQGQE